MNILIIDTATAVQVTALSSGNAVSDQTKEAGESHAVTLFDNIDLAFKEVNIEPKDLDLIGAGIGPGSFTGIRIAVTTARMFSQLFDLPIVGVKTHLMYACSAGDKAKYGENILVAFDAKKGRVFGALYMKGKENITPLEIVQPGDYKIEYLINQIDTKQKTFLIGDGCERYYDEIKPGLSEHYLLSKFKPSGGIVCDLVKKIYSENPDNYRDLNKVVPFYSRKSDAEIMKERGDLTPLPPLPEGEGEESSFYPLLPTGEGG